MNKCNHPKITYEMDGYTCITRCVDCDAVISEFNLETKQVTW